MMLGCIELQQVVTLLGFLPYSKWVSVYFDMLSDATIISSPYWLTQFSVGRVSLVKVLLLTLSLPFQGYESPRKYIASQGKKKSRYRILIIQ